MISKIQETYDYYDYIRTHPLYQAISIFYSAYSIINVLATFQCTNIQMLIYVINLFTLIFTLQKLLVEHKEDIEKVSPRLYSALYCLLQTILDVLYICVLILLGKIAITFFKDVWGNIKRILVLKMNNNNYRDIAPNPSSSNSNNTPGGGPPGGDHVLHPPKRKRSDEELEARSGSRPNIVSAKDRLYVHNPEIKEKENLIRYLKSHEDATLSNANFNSKTPNEFTKIMKDLSKYDHNLFSKIVGNTKINDLLYSKVEEAFQRKRAAEWASSGLAQTVRSQVQAPIRVPVPIQPAPASVRIQPAPVRILLEPVPVSIQPAPVSMQPVSVPVQAVPVPVQPAPVAMPIQSAPVQPNPVQVPVKPQAPETGRGTPEMADNNPAKWMNLAKTVYDICKKNK